jgi:hypothetical protein
MMKIIQRCLHQIFKPTRKSLSKIDGVGECVECEYDAKENIKCKKFTPVNLSVEECKDGHID